MSRKREWGRRGFDNQAYPKLPDKSVLPFGLRVVEGRISKKEGDTWMVRSSGGYAIVGRMFDYEAPAPMTLYIEHLEIDESLRGEGAGKFLVEAIEKHAIRLGFNAVIVSSVPDAVGFWDKLGYRQYEESTGRIPMVRYMSEGRTPGTPLTMGIAPRDEFEYHKDQFYIRQERAKKAMEPELEMAHRRGKLMDSIEVLEHEKWEISDILKVVSSPSERLNLEERRGAVDKRLSDVKSELEDLKGES